MVRVVAVIALLPVAFAATVATDVAKLMTFGDEACTTPGTHQFHKMDSCHRRPAWYGGSYKGACRWGTVTWTYYTDAACVTAVTDPDSISTSTVTKTCGNYQMIDSCTKMDCEGADMTAMTCTAIRAACADEPYLSGAACAADADDVTCCVAKATCDSLTCTAATHVSKANPTTLYCAADTCTVERDESTCCDTRAACTDYTCDAVTLVDHTDKDSLKCAGAACAANADDVTCCVAKATCDSLTCSPATHVSKANPTTLYCAADTCTTDLDESTCCDTRAACTDYTCDAVTLMDRTDKDSLKCAGAACAADADDGTCCVAKASVPADPFSNVALSEGPTDNDNATSSAAYVPRNSVVVVVVLSTATMWS